MSRFSYFLGSLWVILIFSSCFYFYWYLFYAELTPGLSVCVSSAPSGVSVSPGLGTSCPSSEGSPQGGRESPRVWVSPPASCVGSAPHLGSSSETRESTPKPFCSALLSAFSDIHRKNSAFFWGHRPCVQPHHLALAQPPTPPLQ